MCNAEFFKLFFKCNNFTLILITEFKFLFAKLEEREGSEEDEAE